SVSMVILGGMGNVWGVIAGAAFLEYLNLEGVANFNGWMNSHVLVCDPSKQNPSSVVSGGCLNAPLVTFGIYGAIIVLVMLLRPQGLFPERRRELEVETGVHDTPLVDVEKGARARSSSPSRCARSSVGSWPSTRPTSRSRRTRSWL